MTPQEALKIRKNPHFEDVDNEELSRCIDEALEKQIPKKPLNNYGGGYRCPNCQMKHLNPDWVGVKHCDCGQALDWSNN